MISIKLFGITRDIVGQPILDIEAKIETVAELKTFMISAYPRMEGLNSLMVAVNSEYAQDDVAIRSTDEIALIPPVSGG